MIYCPSCGKPHAYSYLYRSFCSETCLALAPRDRRKGINSRRILQYLKVNGWATVEELAHFLEVPPSKVRQSFLSGLMKDGKVEHVYGITDKGARAIE